MATFGEKLRKLRKRHSLTQMQLAEQLGYQTHSTVVLLEKGKIQPTGDLLIKLNQLFGVSADQMLFDHLELDEAE